MRDRITVRGDVDERAVQQLERCVREGDALRGVLCADGHVGYSMPIGGAVAYPGSVSPSGVGFDIGCLAGGSRVTCDDGWSLPIESVRAAHPALCWDGQDVRRIAPNLGAVARGVQPTLAVALPNGRTLVLTPDHEVRTKLGWTEARHVRPGTTVACPVFVGLPYEQPPEQLDGFPEVGPRDERFPALLRVLAHVTGDGHLHPDGRTISLYPTVEADAAALADDLIRLGSAPRRCSGERGPGRPTGLGVRASCPALHARLAALGCPVGRQADGWTAKPMPWLFELPAWQRAQFLSAFASARATSPSVVDGRIANVAISHRGTGRHALDLIARLCESLGFRVGISVGGPVRGGIATQVLQVLGGEAEQLRFFEQVGFCLAYGKRVAAARVASVAWRTGAARFDRVLAESAAVAPVASPRARPRRPTGASDAEDHSGEVAWVPVESVLPSGSRAVYDVATGDEAASFIGEGICVHNCGNKAVRTDVMAADVDVPGVMDEIVRRISFGVGRANDEPVDHPVLDEIRGAAFTPQRKLHDMAAAQLGTVGSGNHYCDLFADEDGRLWIGVHFGSRGFGHRTASGFLALAKGWAFDAKAPMEKMDSPPVLFADDSEIGQGYIAAMELAGRYAYAGRDVVVDRILQILGARAVEEVHNHHNYLWRERHFGQDAWVVRKGCTPAFPGQPGFVGATMGEDAVILEGVESPAGAELLCSTVHGAGRVMSRTQAAGKARWKRTWACPVGGCTERNEQARIATKRPPRCPRHGQVMVKKRVAERVRPGLIDWDATRASLRDQGIELRGGGADEAPAAYKRLDDVLAAHADTVRIRHRLRPIGVAMAGADVYDPYKD